MIKPKTDYKVMSIRIAMKQYEQIAAIVDEHVAGMLNDSDFARRAFASYIDALTVKEKGRGRPRLATQDLVARKLEEKRQTQIIKEETLAAESEIICEELEGTVREDNNVKYCSWKRYEQMGPQITEGELEVPFEMLTRQHLKDQYIPSREAVESITKKTP